MENVSKTKNSQTLVSTTYTITAGDVTDLMKSLMALGSRCHTGATGRSSERPRAEGDLRCQQSRREHIRQRRARSSRRLERASTTGKS